MVTQFNALVEDQDKAFNEKMELVNFNLISQLLRLEYKWTELRIEQGISRYKQLLLLIYRYPDQPVVPDQETDWVIHAHLATGNQYVKDCQMLFNAYLEHENGFGMQAEADRLIWMESFDRVQLLLKQWFNVTPTHSTPPAFCVLRLITKPALGFSG